MALLLELSGAGWTLQVEGPPRRPPAFLPAAESALRLPAGVSARVRVGEELEPAGDGDPFPPFLFENTAYDFYFEAEDAAAELRLDGAKLRHERPLAAGIARHHQINFGNQVGFAELSVVVPGGEDAVIAAEVFPAKIDYRRDYAELRDRVAAESRSLIFAALARTTGEVSPVSSAAPTLAEWAALLRRYAAELEIVLRRIGEDPHSTIVRRTEMRRPERARRVDGRELELALRRRPTRSGGAAAGLVLPQHLPESRHELSYDTAENRYVKAAVLETARRLRRLVREGAEALSRERTPRQAFAHAFAPAAGEAADGLARAMADPVWAEVAAVAPVLPSSPLLQIDPTYRRAARLLRILNGGLEADGAALRAGLKDVATLYEYWCFLALVGLLRQRLDLVGEDVVALRHLGAELRLVKGARSTVRFRSPRSGLEATLTYNPRYAGLPTLPQQPDLVLELPEHLIALDAKYRLGLDSEYIERFGGVGPPTDAINAMHRYRDAIVEPDGGGYRRRIGAALALFPYADESAYRRQRFFASIDAVGIGGLPFLPGSTALAGEWLDRLLAQHGL